MSVAQRFFFSRGVSADLYRQSAIRTGAYAALALIFGVRLAFGAFDYEPMYALVLALVLLVLGIVGLTLSAGQRSGTVQHVALFSLPVVDIALITAMILASGGVESRLMFMYAVPSLASIVVSIPFALTVGGMIIAAFSIAVLSGHYGLLPIIEKTSYAGDSVLVARILRTILFEIVVLGGCIVYAAYLLRRHRQEIEARDEIIYTLVERMRTPLSQEEADAVLAAVSIPSLPIERQYNFGKTISCAVCSSSIPRFRSYWGIRAAHVRLYPFGEYRNDIHCNSCHGAQRSCAHCAEWGARQFLQQEA
ncbi:hypothetical protein IT396_01195 [Candidatus Nomurabacteria bacterium]|nr:hypothetical protein [Candidatus Nomurabacteria bacterium]